MAGALSRRAHRDSKRHFAAAMTATRDAPKTPSPDRGGACVSRRAPGGPRRGRHRVAPQACRDPPRRGRQASRSRPGPARHRSHRGPGVRHRQPRAGGHRGGADLRARERCGRARRCAPSISRNTAERHVRGADLQPRRTVARGGGAGNENVLVYGEDGREPVVLGGHAVSTTSAILCAWTRDGLLVTGHWTERIGPGSGRCRRGDWFVRSISVGVADWQVGDTHLFAEVEQPRREGDPEALSFAEVEPPARRG